MMDSILIAAAGGRTDLVDEGLRLADQLAGVWPRSRLPLEWESKEASSGSTWSFGKTGKRIAADASLPR